MIDLPGPLNSKSHTETVRRFELKKLGFGLFTWPLSRDRRSLEWKQRIMRRDGVGLGPR
jgi:hypothetical protein